MIILDTNVLSELIKPVADEKVLLWLDRQQAGLVASTSISLLEMRSGATILPDGRRKSHLLSLIDGLFAELFDDQLLSFDAKAAVAFSEIVARRRELGRPVGTMDCMIAAIAHTSGASVATRDVDDFADCGVPLINPWDA